MKPPHAKKLPERCGYCKKLVTEAGLVHNEEHEQSFMWIVKLGKWVKQRRIQTNHLSRHHTHFRCNYCGKFIT